MYILQLFFFSIHVKLVLFLQMSSLLTDLTASQRSVMTITKIIVAIIPNAQK